MEGIRVFEGVGIGKALVYKEVKLENLILRMDIISDQVELEQEIFESYVKTAKNQVELLAEHAKDTIGKDEADIFEAHYMMLEDPTLIEGIKEYIKENLVKGSYAVLMVRKDLVNQFLAIDNEYIRARAQDVIDVTDRILRIYLGIKEIDLLNTDEPVIIIANDLKPSETIRFNEFVKGIVLESGSVTSHAAIVAKAKGIPTIVGVANAINDIKEGDTVILDAINNKIIINPNEEESSEYEKAITKQEGEKERLEALVDIKAISKDGKSIKIYGNVGSLAEAKLVRRQGSYGSGLLRSELIYMNSNHLPTEEEQFEYYKEIVQMLPEETIIRTLDIGGDKHLDYYEFPKEDNPFLGKRAIRLCLKEKELFETQLRAILRASNFGNVKIMFPMISCIEEIYEAKEVLNKAKNDLRERNITFNEDIKVGIMVEIPSVAISARKFASEVDFFSIGTNDLCQYTCAVDRMNSEVAHLYQPLHPSIIELIQITIDAAKEANIQVGICGEMAGDKDLACMLMGMGVDELSMSSSMINRVKDKIINTDFSDMVELAKKIKETKTSTEALNIIKENKKY